mgnify:CR=1 FL=1
MKLTPKRLGIINFLIKDKRYYDPQTIRDRVKSRFDKLGLPTVYRILEELVDISLVSEVISDKNKSFYFMCKKCIGEEKHHFICNSCHQVFCIDSCFIDKIKEELEEKQHFQILGHFLQIEGLCPKCLRKEKKQT